MMKTMRVRHQRCLHMRLASAFRRMPTCRCLQWQQQQRIGGNSRRLRTAHRLADVRAQVQQARSTRTKASDHVDEGLQALRQDDVQAAAQAFTQALNVQDATRAERGAACYNRACALARLNKLEACADDIREACGTYNVKFDWVLSDPDLQPLRSSTELFDELAREVGRAGQSSDSQRNLRAEAREPFRGLKLFLFGALAAGASVSTLVLLGKVPASFEGKENAQSLTLLSRNLAINLAGMVGFGLLTRNEVKERDRSRQRVQREDELGRLHAVIVDAPDQEPIQLNELRQLRRVLVLSGPSNFLHDALERKQQYANQLARCKVSVIALDAFGSRSEHLDLASAASGGAHEHKGFKRSGSNSSSGVSTAKLAASAPPGCDLVASDTEKWRRWIRRQFQAAGVDPSKGAYFLIGQSGQVTRSAVGEPVWEQLSALPEPSSWQARLGGE